MRDPSLFRSKAEPHHRTGTKYKVYPLYDFACPIIDSLEGVTHALRSNEYTLRNTLYVWVAEKAGLRVPKIEDFSRLNFEYVLLSKRKLNKLVASGAVSGWDDPRCVRCVCLCGVRARTHAPHSFPTIRGILRAGMEVSVLRDFVFSVGSSKSTVRMTTEKMWVMNKKYLDGIVHRHIALLSSNVVPLTLSDVPGTASGDVRSVALHPKRPELGSKARLFTPTLWLAQADAALLHAGDEVTLMSESRVEHVYVNNLACMSCLGWGNVVITDVTRGADGVVSAASARLNLSGAFDVATHVAPRVDVRLGR
jgi:glutamyl-tRNA synthetase